MTRIYLNVYYKFLAFFCLIILTEDTHFYRLSFSEIELRGVSHFFDLIGLPRTYLYLAYLALIIPIFFLASEFPNLFFRILAAAALWLACSTIANITHFRVPRIPILIATFLLVFVSPKMAMASRDNAFFMRLIRNLIFVNYVMAGGWKIVHALQLPSWNDFVFSFMKTPWDHLAYVMASGAANKDHIHIALQFPTLAPWGFVFFILLQFFSFLPCFFTKLVKPWAYALIGFHLLMGVIMGLPFDFSIAAFLFIVLLGEDFVRLTEVKDLSE